MVWSAVNDQRHLVQNDIDEHQCSEHIGRHERRRCPKADIKKTELVWYLSHMLSPFPMQSRIKSWYLKQKTRRIALKKHRYLITP